MKDGLPWRVRKAKAAAVESARPPAPTWPKVKDNHNPHSPRGVPQWKPGRIWEGELVCIVGGGPSLKLPENIAKLAQTKGHRVVAINNAWGKITPEEPGNVPWADMLFFTDCQWWRWNGHKVLAKWPTDRLIVTATSDMEHVVEPRISRLWRDRNKWCPDQGWLFGYDGGTQSTNLVAQLGARKIVLFGIDLGLGPNGETQYHNSHKRPTAVGNYKTKFIPTMIEAVKQCKALGIEIVRATPGFDIGAPLVSIEEALQKPVGCPVEPVRVISEDQPPEG